MYFFVFIFVLLSGCNNKEELTIKEEALKYLENKYEQSFVINKSEKNNSSGLYKINASPENKPSQSFFVFVYERDMKFSDNYLKTFIADEIQKRDKAEMERIFSSAFHSFYGNVMFEDADLSTITNLRLKQILSQDPNVLHDYVIYLDQPFSRESDKEKMIKLLEYLKEQGVKNADIDFVYFSSSPAKAAYESPSYYLKEEGVDRVVSLQPNQYEGLSSTEEMKKFMDQLLEG